MTEFNIKKIKQIIQNCIKENAMGLVCKCGGGGTDENNNTCKVCGGCGIYEWDINFLSEQLIKELN